MPYSLRHGLIISFLAPSFSVLKTVSYDGSEFQDIFDIDHFISSLRDEVRILKELPPRLKTRVELGMFYSLPPVSWSNISYYLHQVGLRQESRTIAFYFSYTAYSYSNELIFNNALQTDSSSGAKA